MNYRDRMLAMSMVCVPPPQTPSVTVADQLTAIADVVARMGVIGCSFVIDPVSEMNKTNWCVCLLDSDIDELPSLLRAYQVINTETCWWTASGHSLDVALQKLRLQAVYAYEWWELR